MLTHFVENVASFSSQPSTTVFELFMHDSACKQSRKASKSPDTKLSERMWSTLHRHNMCLFFSIEGGKLAVRTSSVSNQ